MKRVSLAEATRRRVSHNPAIGKRVLLASGDVPGVTNLSQAVFAPGQVAPAHAHDDMYEVFVVSSGAGRIEVDGAAHVLEANDCVVVAPGEAHEITNSGEEDLVLLYFGVERRGD